MKYSYVVSMVHRKKGTTVMDSLSVNVKGPFSTLKDCYLDAGVLTDYFGNSRMVYHFPTGYEWMEMVSALLYNEAEESRLEKYKCLSWETSVESVLVVMTINSYVA